MSRVVTQPSPCEHSSRSVAPMSFPLWSIAGIRELTRAAADLAMGVGGRKDDGIEQVLTDYERLLKIMQARSNEVWKKPAGRSFGLLRGQRSLVVRLLWFLVRRQVGLSVLA